MPSKTKKMKIGRCVRKKLDGKDFLVVGLVGKVPGALLKKLKAGINQAVVDAQIEDEESE